MSQDVVARARALVGCRFRPQGRQPDLGLDCLGVVLHAHRLRLAQPATYRVRDAQAVRIREGLWPFFKEVSADALIQGDVLLLQVAENQAHLAIHCGDSIVHADARLGRVVETPSRYSWPIISAHRKRSTNEV